MPVSMLKNVVLPAPFGPMRLTMEPSGIRKSTSFTATRPPNSLRTRSAVRRSVIARLAVRVGALDRHVVVRRVGHAVLHLLAVPSLGDEPGRSEDHHQHDDRAIDPELVLRRLEFDPGRVQL